MKMFMSTLAPAYPISKDLEVAANLAKRSAYRLTRADLRSLAHDELSPRLNQWVQQQIVMMNS